jgi:hypothetical protein
MNVFLLEFSVFYCIRCSRWLQLCRGCCCGIVCPCRAWEYRPAAHWLDVRGITSIARRTEYNIIVCEKRFCCGWYEATWHFRGLHWPDHTCAVYYRWLHFSCFWVSCHTFGWHVCFQSFITSYYRKNNYCLQLLFVYCKSSNLSSVFSLSCGLSLSISLFTVLHCVSCMTFLKKRESCSPPEE